MIRNLYVFAAFTAAVLVFGWLIDRPLWALGYASVGGAIAWFFVAFHWLVFDDFGDIMSFGVTLFFWPVALPFLAVTVASFLMEVFSRPQEPDTRQAPR